MTDSDSYLASILARHSVDASAGSPLRSVQASIAPIIARWGGNAVLDIRPSGSFAKGTAVRGGTDIDLFVSLSSTVNNTLEEIYTTLYRAIADAGHLPRRQNVSIGLSLNGWKVDVTPGRRQDQYGNYHSLWSNKNQGWLQTNINEHINLVSNSGRADEIKLLKIWRNKLGLEWPSFYLELFTINALYGARKGNLAQNVSKVLAQIVQSIDRRRLIDPSNTNNIVSNSLTPNEKAILIKNAHSALLGRWGDLYQ
jgi:hypothetical protein